MTRVKLFINDVAAENADAICEGLTEKLKFPLLCETIGVDWVGWGGGGCCGCIGWLDWGAIGAGRGAAGAWRAGFGLAGLWLEVCLNVSFVNILSFLWNDYFKNIIYLIVGTDIVLLNSYCLIGGGIGSVIVSLATSPIIFNASFVEW